MKKIVLLSAITLIGLVQNVNAQEDFKIDGLDYTTGSVGDGYVAIQGGLNVSPNLVIPQYVTHGGKTYKVVAIQNFVKDENVVSLTIPNSFRVRKEAFVLAKKLEEVILGDSVELRKHCFAECPQLKKVFFKGQLYGIYREAFLWNESTQPRGFYFVSSVPPTVMMREGFDESVYRQVTLYVPANSVERYKNDEVWGKFKISTWNPDK